MMKKIVNINSSSIKKNIKLTTQFFFRMREGNGKCIYIIGIGNNCFLQIKNFKTIFECTLYFINIINKYKNIKYKLRFFYINEYIYSIIIFYDKQTINNNFIDFANY